MPALAPALLVTWIGLVEHHPELRTAIAGRAGSTLLTLLKTQSPDTHRSIYHILTIVSGQSRESVTMPGDKPGSNTDRRRDSPPRRRTSVDGNE